MRIKPLTGQVLVELLPAESVSVGGIAIPNRNKSAEEEQAEARSPVKPPGQRARVCEIGPWPKAGNGALLMPEFGLGAQVIIGSHAGIDMEWQIGRRFRMVEQNEVLAVISES